MPRKKTNSDPIEIIGIDISSSHPRAYHVNPRIGPSPLLMSGHTSRYQCKDLVAKLGAQNGSKRANKKAGVLHAAGIAMTSRLIQDALDETARRLAEDFRGPRSWKILFGVDKRATGRFEESSILLATHIAFELSSAELEPWQPRDHRFVEVGIIRNSGNAGHWVLASVCTLAGVPIPGRPARGHPEKHRPSGTAHLSQTAEKLYSRAREIYGDPL